MFSECSARVRRLSGSWIISLEWLLSFSVAENFWCGLDVAGEFFCCRRMFGDWLPCQQCYWPVRGNIPTRKISLAFIFVFFFKLPSSFSFSVRSSISRRALESSPLVKRILFIICSCSNMSWRRQLLAAFPAGDELEWVGQPNNAIPCAACVGKLHLDLTVVCVANNAARDRCVMCAADHQKCVAVSILFLLSPISD